MAIPTLLVWLFFLFASMKDLPGDSWNSEYLFTATLLLAFYLNELSLKPLFLSIIFTFSTLVAFSYLVMSRYPNIDPLPGAGWSNVYATQKMIAHIPFEKIDHNAIIYCNDYYWLSSLLGYFIPGHPRIYSTDLRNGKQYYFWNKIQKPAHYGDKVFVISYSSAIPNVHFQNCMPVSQVTDRQKNYFQGVRYWHLYIYSCYSEAI